MTFTILETELRRCLQTKFVPKSWHQRLISKLLKTLLTNLDNDRLGLSLAFNRKSNVVFVFVIVVTLKP